MDIYNNITKYMGISLIIISILNFANLIEMNPVYLMGFSLAALLFSFTDWLDAKSDDDEYNPFKWLRLKKAAFFIAVVAFMIVPYLTINWSKEIIDKVSTFATLVSIGLVFYIISIKQSKVYNEKLQKYITQEAYRIAEEFGENKLPNLVNKVIEENVDEDYIKGIAQEHIQKLEREKSNT